MSKVKEFPIVRCPECGELSDSIKHYKLFDYIVFILFAAWYGFETHICCPKCMRKHILAKCFSWMILTGNICWILLVFPYSVIAYMMTYTKGHSKKVYELIN